MGFADLVSVVSYALAACLVLPFLRKVPMRPGCAAVRCATAVFVVGFVALHMFVRTPVLVQVAALLVLACAYVRATRAVAGLAALVLGSVFVIALDMVDVLVLALDALAHASGFGGADSAAKFVLMRVATVLADFGAVAALSGNVVALTGRLRRADAVLLALPAATFLLFRTVSGPLLAPGAGTSSQTAALAVLLAASTLASLMGNAYYLIARQQRDRNAELTHLLERQRALYEARLESDGAIRRMRHDILNQLALIEGTADGEARARHLETIRERVAPPSALARTHNPALDVVLAQKASEASERGVLIDAFANLQDAGFIDGVDVCAIFANALDNAIEACAHIEGEGAARTVVLRAGTVQGHIVAKVENPYAGELVRDGGRFASTKGGGKAHGLGIPSIERSASRYGGTVRAEAADGRFTLTVVIPLP